jgi:hypothetical protein
MPPPACAQNYGKAGRAAQVPQITVPERSDEEIGICPYFQTGKIGLSYP